MIYKHGTKLTLKHDVSINVKYNWSLWKKLGLDYQTRDITITIPTGTILTIQLIRQSSYFDIVKFKILKNESPDSKLWSTVYEEKADFFNRNFGSAI